MLHTSSARLWNHIYQKLNYCNFKIVVSTTRLSVNLVASQLLYGLAMDFFLAGVCLCDHFIEGRTVLGVTEATAKPEINCICIQKWECFFSSPIMSVNPVGNWTLFAFCNFGEPQFLISPAVDEFYLSFLDFHWNSYLTLSLWRPLSKPPWQTTVIFAQWKAPNKALRVLVLLLVFLDFS